MRLSLGLVLGGSIVVSAQTALSEHLVPLAPFVGKTWRGEFVDSTPEKPMFDVARWETALNGQAIRVLHSVNDGLYGGETILYWDAGKARIVSHYFTTAGFYTAGTIEVKGGTVTSRETVTGNANGISEVESTSELLPDGRMHARARYLKNGEWVAGNEIVYAVDPQAEVRFR
jgi:hypothetical protein